MSIQTNYTVNDEDLSVIFVSRNTSTLLNEVEYSYFNGTEYIDLSYLFEPQTADPGSLYTITNYTVDNYTPLWTNVAGTYDLGQIFLNTAYNYFTISGGSYSVTSYVSGTTTTYNIIINPGTTTLKFNILPDSSFTNIQLVGGGGGGGGAYTNAIQGIVYLSSGGGGGGGGNLLINNFIVDTNEYTITVGAGGYYGYGAYDANAEPGYPGNPSSIIGTGINCVSNGGSGGGGGKKDSHSPGGTGGNVTITTLDSGTQYNGTGGNGGQGNVQDSLTSGTSGSNSYFYNNPSLSYSPSTEYPTIYAPSSSYTPQSVTLTNWYSFSGGGGGANSNSSNLLVAYQGNSGRGYGGSQGGVNSGNIFAAEYPSFGGGGGGGGAIGGGVGFNGGNGIAVIWFSYTT